MTKQTYTEWLMEYYPEEAGEVAATSNRIAIIQHSLKKWQGLSEQVLQNYNLGCAELDYTQHVYDSKSKTKVLKIDYSTCALCAYDTLVDVADEFISCGSCPIKEHTDATCDEAYDHFVETGETDKMLEILQATLELEKLFQLKELNR